MSIIQKIDQQQGKFLKVNQNQAQTQRLSEEEKSMIDNEFSTARAPLTFYKHSGTVKTELPTAKGENIDFKA